MLETQEPEVGHVPVRTESKSGMSPFAYASVFFIGTGLGVLFTKSEVANWQRVHDMFLFKEPHMYLIIGVAIAVAAISMLLIKSLGIHNVQGVPIKYKPKPFHKGVIIGGFLFGAGWAITGACPGPIYAQIGGGEWMALLTFAGAMSGMFSFAWMKPMLPR